MFSTSLRAFDEVVRAGSIRKASEALGVAPSSVSRHIAILEREVGTALFDRRARGVELTHAGSLVADYTRSVLLEYDTLRTDLDDIRGIQRRLLRVALVESVASFGPISAISKFREQFGAVAFNLRLMPAPRVVEAVKEGLCDIGLAYCAAPDPEILMLANVPEPIVLVVRSDHPLASASEVELTDIAELPLALPDFDFGVRQILDRACAAAGLRLSPVLSSNTFETLRDFARCGSGAAVLPLRALGRPQPPAELRAIPLAGAVFRDATIDVIVLRKRRLPRVVKAFVETLLAEISPSFEGQAV
jgi:DNA-binding transcriptional LysR family regulator